MKKRYSSVYQKLQECFIMIRLLHSGVIPNDGSIENVKQNLLLIRSVLEKDLSTEHMILIYCINMMLMIMEEEDNRQKIFDFADLVHNMPEIGMGKRDLHSFKEEIASFNQKYNSQYFTECLDNRRKITAKKPELSELEKKYKRFDIISTIVLFSMLALSFVFGALFLFAKSDEHKTLWGCILALCTLLFVLIPSKITKKRDMYFMLLRKERETIVRTGLFKEIYDAHRQDRFEANLICDKWLYEEYHNNTIDIGIVRNNHEFLILFDEHTLSIVVDEETDHSIEANVPLTHFATIEEVFSFLNLYTFKHSDTQQIEMGNLSDKPDVEVFFEFNGTRKHFVADGYRPHHLITGQYLTTGIHHYYDQPIIPSDGTAKGTITFLTPEAYPCCIWVGKKIPIQEGERVVGCATVLRVFNEVLLGEGKK